MITRQLFHWDARMDMDCAAMVLAASCTSWTHIGLAAEFLSISTLTDSKKTLAASNAGCGVASLRVTRSGDKSSHAQMPLDE
jgi:hypothetical protein